MITLQTTTAINKYNDNEKMNAVEFFGCLRTWHSSQEWRHDKRKGQKRDPKMYVKQRASVTNNKSENTINNAINKFLKTKSIISETKAIKNDNNQQHFAASDAVADFEKPKRELKKGYKACGTNNNYKQNKYEVHNMFNNNKTCCHLHFCCCC